MSKNNWTPFQLAERVPLTDEQINEIAQVSGVTPEEVRKVVEQHVHGSIVVKNSLYQVELRLAEGDLIWLSIKRLDKQPIHDWRDLQRIKNELVGPECEAVELYPAESRLVDTANQYHLYCSPDPTFRFSFGMKNRLVSDKNAGGSVNRPFTTD